MQATPTTQEAVQAVLADWADSYKKRDLPRLLSHLAPDSDVLMYGTNADEKRVARAGVQMQAERDWAQTESAEFILHTPAISAAGVVAWVAADATFKVEVGGQAMAFPARFTGVLEQREGKWLVVQAHFSLPAPSQEETSSVPDVATG